MEMNSERIPLLVHKYRPQEKRDDGCPKKRRSWTKEHRTGILPSRGSEEKEEEEEEEEDFKYF